MFLRGVEKVFSLKAQDPDPTLTPRAMILDKATGWARVSLGILYVGKPRFGPCTTFVLLTLNPRLQTLKALASLRHAFVARPYRVDARRWEQGGKMIPAGFLRGPEFWDSDIPAVLVLVLSV